MTRHEIVPQMLVLIKSLFVVFLAGLPPSTSQRLNGLETEMLGLVEQLTEGLWRLAFEYLTERAWTQAHECPVCHKARERQRDAVNVTVLGRELSIPVDYYYCRKCPTSDCPMRKWLGVREGTTSGGFERAVTSLTREGSFGEAAEQMLEQHGQGVDRTLVQRVTYRVGSDAVAFLAEKYGAVQRQTPTTPMGSGVPRVFLTADGGSVRVGVLTRPSLEESKELTPVRQLPKGTRAQGGREMRVIVAHPTEPDVARWVDIHMAPLDHPEISGARMWAVARMAGMGTRTQMYGVFDMGTWIHTQFEAQFSTNPWQIRVDWCHVTEYLWDASKVLYPVVVVKPGAEPAKAAEPLAEPAKAVESGEIAKPAAGSTESPKAAKAAANAKAEKAAEDARKKWMNTQKDALCRSDWQSVVNALTRPVGPGEEEPNDDVTTARRYVFKFHEYMDYAASVAEGLPTGSGEGEGAVRHLIRARLDVPGAWREENPDKVAALIAIHESEQWDAFWEWRERRDIERWKERQLGAHRGRFFGRPCARKGAAHESPSMAAAPS
jgi:hypothetical protein